MKQDAHDDARAEGRNPGPALTLAPELQAAARKKRNTSFALIGIASALVTVASIAHPERDVCTTAIAYRDHVPNDQKQVSKAFTLPIIEVAYDNAIYIEADGFTSRRADFHRAIEAAHAERCVVDIFWLVNGGHYADWIEGVPREQRPVLRLVYDTGGGDARQGPQWLESGAQSFVGHPDLNIAPAFYTFFLPAWVSGAGLEGAVTTSNALTLKVLHAARALELADDDDVEALWRGTEAQLFGDPRLAYP